jgi:hypothetical protein
LPGTVACLTRGIAYDESDWQYNFGWWVVGDDADGDWVGMAPRPDVCHQSYDPALPTLVIVPDAEFLGSKSGEQGQPDLERLLRQAGEARGAPAFLATDGWHRSVDRWNVLVWNWQRFADEPSVRRVEAKIWATPVHPNEAFDPSLCGGQRWMFRHEKAHESAPAQVPHLTYKTHRVHTSNTPGVSQAELLAQAYGVMFHTPQGADAPAGAADAYPEIRVVGAGIGAQLATAGVAEAVRKYAARAPTLLAWVEAVATEGSLVGDRGSGSPGDDEGGAQAYTDPCTFPTAPPLGTTILCVDRPTDGEPEHTARCKLCQTQDGLCDAECWCTRENTPRSPATAITNTDPRVGTGYVTRHEWIRTYSGSVSGSSQVVHLPAPEDSVWNARGDVWNILARQVSFLGHGYGTAHVWHETTGVRVAPLNATLGIGVLAPLSFRAPVRNDDNASKDPAVDGWAWDSVQASSFGVLAPEHWYADQAGVWTHTTIVQHKLDYTRDTAMFGFSARPGSTPPFELHNGEDQAPIVQDQTSVSWPWEQTYQHIQAQQRLRLHVLQRYLATRTPSMHGSLVPSVAQAIRAQSTTIPPHAATSAEDLANADTPRSFVQEWPRGYGRSNHDSTHDPAFAANEWHFLDAGV